MTFNELIDQLNATLTAFSEQVGYDVVSGNVTDETDFSSGAGNYVNSPILPFTDSIIPLETTGIVRGGFVIVWYKGNVLSKTKFSGGTITMFSGVNVLDELCRVFIDCDKASGAFSVSIQTGFTGDYPVPIGNPAQMSITSIGEPFQTSPATMTITDIAS